MENKKTEFEKLDEFFSELKEENDAEQFALDIQEWDKHMNLVEAPEADEEEIFEDCLSAIDNVG